MTITSILGCMHRADGSYIACQVYLLEEHLQASALSSSQQLQVRSAPALLVVSPDSK